MAEKQMYINSALLEMLHKLPMFSMFTDIELRRMIYSGKVVRLQRFDKDDIVIQEESFGRWVYIMLKGSVKVSKKGVDICTLCNQGEILGEIGAVQAQIRSATVTALEPCIFIAINISVIEHMSGSEKHEYLQRINDFLTPMIHERMSRTMEISTVMDQITKKRKELDALQKRLYQLGASEEKNLLQHLLEGE